MKIKLMLEGVKRFLFPVESNEVCPAHTDKIKELLVEHRRRQRRTEIYFELFIVFLIAGALLFWVMTALFNLCVEDWIAGGKLRLKDLWNILMYAIPYTFLAASAGLFITSVILSVYYHSTCLVYVYFIRRRQRRKAYKENLLNTGGPDEN